MTTVACIQPKYDSSMYTAHFWEKGGGLLQMNSSHFTFPEPQGWQQPAVLLSSDYSFHLHAPSRIPAAIIIRDFHSAGQPYYPPHPVGEMWWPSTNVVRPAKSTYSFHITSCFQWGELGFNLPVICVCSLCIALPKTLVSLKHMQQQYSI